MFAHRSKPMFGMLRYALIAAALLLSGAALAQPPAVGGGCTPSAHVFCVTNTSTDTTDRGPVGSLKRAITDSDAAGGANIIGFAIPSTDPAHPTSQTIMTPNGLPSISLNGTVTSLTVDGYSQPGSMVNTNTPEQGGLATRLMIEIVGNGATNGFSNCCALPLPALTVQGVNMHGFGGAISGGSATKVYGCFIGTNIDGTASGTTSGYPGPGIHADGNTQIGGTEPWQRNLISGNFYGVEGYQSAATVVIEGNLIGTDASGTRAIPNFAGLGFPENMPGLRVGCTSAGSNPTCATAASRNVISGNGLYGMTMQDANTSPAYVHGGTQIKGNYIGSDWTGTQPLPNGDAAHGCTTGYVGGGGIETVGGQSGAALIIGGFAPGEANLIAYNYGPGISSSTDISASFDSQANAIHNNRNTNIIFRDCRWIPNDPGDADTGANNQQNYPVIQSAHVSNGQLIVTYSVDSATMNSTYPLRIDFYIDIDEGSGEFLGSDTYPQANAQGMQTATLTLPADAQTPVGFVATATAADHYTSEFSPSYVFDRIFADRFEGH